MPTYFTPIGIASPEDQSSPASWRCRDAARTNETNASTREAVLKQSRARLCGTTNLSKEIAMSMSRLAPLVAASVLSTAVFAAPTSAQTDAAPTVKDYTVFVDPPSAYAFIKLPTGWRFIGKLDAGQMQRLPEGTVTSLLPDEGHGVNVASERPASAATTRQ